MDRPSDASPPPESAAAPGPVPPAEVRQRWRITYAREPVPTEQVGRAGLEAWQAALATSGLPVAGLEPGGTGRARISIAAPLPAPYAGEAELADLFLFERRLVWQVREALEERLPPGHRWVGAEDVWVGSPPLPGRVVAADWRVALGAEAPRERLIEASRVLVSARSLPRIRVKGGSEKRYDLRPLLEDVSVEAAPPAAPGAGSVVRIRTTFLPDLGAGRPEEVVAALAEAAGTTLAIVGVTRERLLLHDEPLFP